MVTETQKRIYNTFLKESRKGQPWKARQNFDKLDNESCVALDKLERFFKSQPNIDWNIYFSAPHHVYPDDTYYNLEYFTTQKAKKTYAIYIKNLELEDPDTNGSLIRLQQALKFVLEFCQEMGLTLEDYPTYSEDNLPKVVDHLKSHKINFYTLHALGVSRLNIEQKILDFIFGDFYGTHQKTKNKFFASKKMKEFSKQAKLKIQEKLKNN